MTTNERPPFSYSVRVGHISANPVEVHIEAGPKERAALAALWSVVEVKNLVADLQVSRWKKDGVKVKGRVSADIVQSCVVTLDPVEAHIDEPLETIFVPEGSRLARVAANDSAEMILDPDGPDLPEVFSGDVIDVGETVTEHAALAIDPYPRKPGAAFSAHVESTEADDARPNPFAVLQGLKKE